MKKLKTITTLFLVLNFIYKGLKMNQNLLKDLDESFETLFDNFNRKNGSEALKINLHCIKSNYLSLQEDDETSKKELEIIKEHLGLLEYIKRSCVYLSGTFDLKQLQAQMNLFNKDLNLLNKLNHKGLSNARD